MQLKPDPLGVMKKKDVVRVVTRALDSFEYRPASNTIGTPWSADRVAAEIDKLRSCLVDPELRPVRREPPEVATKVVQDLWIVAVTDAASVFYDPSADEFGLAWDETSGQLFSINVCGDLIGTFCAR